MDPRERDILIRTVIGEAGNEPPEGQAAVAHVILNRLKSGDYGKSVRDVVLAPNQFEPWQKFPQQLQSISPQSTRYQQVGDIVDGVTAGDIPDPTSGATHFLNPQEVVRRGDGIPAWANKDRGLRIGNHVFHAPNGPVTDPINLNGTPADLNSAGVQPLAYAGKAPDPMPQTSSSDDDFSKEWGFDAKTAKPAAPAAKSAQSDPFLSEWGIKPESLNGAKPAVRDDATIDPKTGEVVIGGKPFSKPGWSGAQNFANGVLQGAGVPFSAALAAVKEKLANGGDFGDLYNQAKTQFSGARSDYTAANPGTAAATELGGSLTSAVPAGMLAGGLLAAGGRAAGVAPSVMDFLAGSGSGSTPVGNALMRTGSLAANGAIQGGGNALLSAGLSDRPVGQNVAMGAGLGAVLGPTLAGAFGLGKYGLDVGKAAIQPFSQAGRESIVDNMLAKLASGGPTQSVAPTIPGVENTLAQATGNSGIAAAERAVRAVRPNDFVARDAANMEARAAALAPVVGDRTTVASMEAAREAQAIPLLKDAFANKSPVMAHDVVDTIDEILAGPNGQRDSVVKALGNIRSKLVQREITMPDGTKTRLVQDDPEQLYGIRKAVTDLLSPAAQNEESKAAQQAARELGTVKDALDSAIERGAPGYGKYLKTYADMSKPIDAQNFLQKLNLTDMNGNLTLGRVDSAIKSIEKQRVAGGAQAAKSIPDDHMKLLYNLRDSLRQQGNTVKGKAMGSDTFQNLATNNLMASMGAPAAVLGNLAAGNQVTALLGYLGRKAYEGQNGPMLDVLTNKLLSGTMPQRAAALAQQGGNKLNLPPLGVIPAVDALNLRRRLGGVEPAAQ